MVLTAPLAAQTRVRGRCAGQAEGQREERLMLFLVATHVFAFLIGAIVIYILCSTADDKRKAPLFVSKPIIPRSTPENDDRKTNLKYH